MSTSTNAIEALANQEYKYGFVTDIDADAAPRGLNEDIIRLISAKKKEPEFMLQWRLRAFRHWEKMVRSEGEPRWANVKFPQIDYQDIIYYSAPKSKKPLKSLDEVDPELLQTFEKLGIPLQEQKQLVGVAVDAVFDSVSVATTFQKKLAELGIIFGSFSEAVQNHPDLVQRYLVSVVPYTDNFYAALNSAVFSDGSFCYIPKGVRCPMELSTYFRINALDTGQFERTLIIADEGAYVSYLEGCTAPMRDTNHKISLGKIKLTGEIFEGARHAQPLAGNELQRRLYRRQHSATCFHGIQDASECALMGRRGQLLPQIRGIDAKAWKGTDAEQAAGIGFIGNRVGQRQQIAHRRGIQYVHALHDERNVMRGKMRHHLFPVRVGAIEHSHRARRGPPLAKIDDLADDLGRLFVIRGRDRNLHRLVEHQLSLLVVAAVAS